MDAHSHWGVGSAYGNWTQIHVRELMSLSTDRSLLHDFS
jgi:hypothetical protein